MTAEFGWQARNKPSPGAFLPSAEVYWTVSAMGLAIVMIVGAILGWLASIIVDRGNRVAADVCALGGIIGAVAGALLGGRVPLLSGVTPTQLLCAVLGALTAITAANAAGLSGLHLGHRNI